MKKRGYHIFFAALCGLCSACLLVVWLLERSGIYLWLGGIATAHLSFFFTCAVILLVPIWLFAFLWCRISSKAARIMIGAVLALLLVPALWVQSFDYAWNISAEKYQVYTSADEAHTVVVMDASYFHSVYGDVYQMTSRITMAKIGSFHGEIGSNYTLHWEDDHIVIECGGKKTTCYLKG